MILWSLVVAILEHVDDVVELLAGSLRLTDGESAVDLGGVIRGIVFPGIKVLIDTFGESNP